MFRPIYVRRPYSLAWLVPKVVVNLCFQSICICFKFFYFFFLGAQLVRAHVIKQAALSEHLSRPTNFRACLKPRTQLRKRRADWLSKGERENARKQATVESITFSLNCAVPEGKTRVRSYYEFSDEASSMMDPSQMKSCSPHCSATFSSNRMTNDLLPLPNIRLSTAKRHPFFVCKGGLLRDKKDGRIWSF